METPAIKNVNISADSKTITFNLMDGTTREIKQSLEFSSRDAMTNCIVSIAAALLQAYDRIDALEKRLRDE